MADGGRLWRLGPPGRGPALILLPGIEGTARVFARQHSLAARRPVYAVDLPDGETIDEIARRVADLAGHLGEVAVLGASFGGLVGRAWAELGGVTALVTVGTVPAPALRPASLALARRLVGHLPAGVFRRLYRRRIAARMREEGVARALAAPILAALPDRDLLCRRLDAILGWNPQRPPAVRTLWLRGQLDREAGWSAAAVARYLPGVAFEIVPGGHRPMLTHPEALHAAVERFLD